MARPPDPVLEFAAREQIAVPDVAPVSRQSATLAASGAGLGALLAGPPGAVVGGAAGWALDAVRRKLTRR